MSYPVAGETVLVRHKSVPQKGGFVSSEISKQREVDIIEAVYAPSEEPFPHIRVASGDTYRVMPNNMGGDAKWVTTS